MNRPTRSLAGAVPGVPDAPPPELLFKRRINLLSSLRQLWTARETVLTLAQRDFLARYKQASLGVAWALMTPLALMVLFTVLFRRVADVDTGGAPYALFAYLGLLPWTFFATSLTSGSSSLLSNRPLLNKVALPREVFPVASVSVALVDMAIASTVLVVLFAVHTTAPEPTAVVVPVLLLIQLAFGVAVALLSSVVVVYLRDLRHAIPLVLQLGIIATPVAYDLSVVPAAARIPYAVLNPLAPVIDGYRRTVLLGVQPRWGLVAAAGAAAAVYLVGAFALFKRLEGGITDVA